MDSLSLLSVIIPARDEEGCIASTAEHVEANPAPTEAPLAEERLGAVHG